MDVARKLLILARECGYRTDLDDIVMEGAVDSRFLKGATLDELMANLREYDAIFDKKVQKAKESGRVLRYVASIREGQCRCGIEAVDVSDPLYKVSGGENALAFTTDYYKPIPLVIRLWCRHCSDCCRCAF